MKRPSKKHVIEAVVAGRFAERLSSRQNPAHIVPVVHLLLEEFHRAFRGDQQAFRGYEAVPEEVEEEFHSERDSVGLDFDGEFDELAEAVDLVAGAGPQAQMQLAVRRVSVDEVDHGLAADHFSARSALRTLQQTHQHQRQQPFRPHAQPRRRQNRGNRAEVRRLRGQLHRVGKAASIDRAIPSLPLRHLARFPLQRRPQRAVSAVPQIRDLPAGHHTTRLPSHEDPVDGRHGDVGDQFPRDGPLVGVDGLLGAVLQFLQLRVGERREARLHDLLGVGGDGGGGADGGHGEDGVESHGGLGEELGEELRPGRRGRSRTEQRGVGGVELETRGESAELGGVGGARAVEEVDQTVVGERGEGLLFERLAMLRERAAESVAQTRLVDAVLDLSRRLGTKEREKRSTSESPCRNSPEFWKCGAGRHWRRRTRRPRPSSRRDCTTLPRTLSADSRKTGRTESSWSPSDNWNGKNLPKNTPAKSSIAALCQNRRFDRFDPKSTRNYSSPRCFRSEIPRSPTPETPSKGETVESEGGRCSICDWFIQGRTYGLAIRCCRRGRKERSICASRSSSASSRSNLPPTTTHMFSGR